ncbi:MAG: multicopper oxidase domain-containing protein [Desulfarculaceae bacterium]|jgi:hypothetical protein
MKHNKTRRAFITALGSLLASSPLAALAQNKDSTHAAHGHDSGSAPAKTKPATGHHHGVKAGQHTDMGPAHAWRDPGMPASPPSPLMGRQMGKVHTLNVPPLGYQKEGKVKVYEIIAQPVERMLTDARPKPSWRVIAQNNRFKGGMHHAYPQPARLWGYNGQVPGPTIECVQGDRVRIILKNQLPEPTSIHWHGLEVPNAMDGAGGTTEPPTPPGGTRIYEFTLHQNGTFMYHTGFNMMKQDGMGLGGFVVIHPKQYRNRIDKDVAIMLQAFALAPGNQFPNLATMDFNWFTMNGKVAPDIEIIRVKQGQRVRLRFGNLT